MFVLAGRGGTVGNRVWNNGKVRTAVLTGGLLSDSLCSSASTLFIPRWHSQLARDANCCPCSCKRADGFSCTRTYRERETSRIKDLESNRQQISFLTAAVTVHSARPRAPTSQQKQSLQETSWNDQEDFFFLAASFTGLI